MKTIRLSAILFGLIFSTLYLASTATADDRGLTGIEPMPAYEPVLVQPAVEGTGVRLETPPPDFYQSPWMKYTDDWILIASDEITVPIPEGFQLSVYFDPGSEYLTFVDPTIPLSEAQQAAVDRAPAWLRDDLYDNFRRFDYSFAADLVANEVLNAPDPYVDEVAFQAAHIAPDVLGYYTYMQLLLENAQGVYTADSALDYIEIIDYGDSNDDDYWSTALYRIVEEGGDTIQVEVDREIYYWYVVHPKLSDEMPTYINPETGNPADPPVGVFWRDYFWTHADSGYPLLSEQFEGCDFLWAHETNFSGPDNGAVEVVSTWITDVMNWGAGSERPIQPVRIYALHCGNCGEYSDITAAAGRTALIPTVCTTNYCEDHTWNEFWDRDWISWEPVNNMVNSPLTYENIWGKVLSGVFNWRGDGYVWDVTERYSEGISILNVTVYDSVGKPADGEAVTIKSNALWGGFYYVTWGITNSQGMVSFTLGDEQTFYAKVTGPLGSYPYSGGVVLVIDLSAAGTTYEWECSMYEYPPDLDIALAPPYPDPLDDYLMEIDYQCEYETVYGTYFTYNEFMEKMTTGVTDFFIANEENYFAYNLFQPAEGFSILDNTLEGSVSFVLPTAEPWYAVFSSRELSINRPRMNVAVDIYRNSSIGIEGAAEGSLPQSFSLGTPCPNPFNSETLVSFAIPKNANVKLAVHNLLGREVAVLTEGYYTAGEYNIRWSGMSDDGSSCASGIYLVRMIADGRDFSRKVCLLK